MKTLYIDCGMGAAGDMLAAALLELLPKPDEFIVEINSFGIPNVQIKKELLTKCGIIGTHITVTVRGEEKNEHCYDHSHYEEHHYNDENDNVHEHRHDHTHDNHKRHHNGMDDIELIIADLPISEKVKADVMAVYNLIAEAESHAHGVPVREVHFHEAGAMDAVADIVSVCLLMEKIAPEQVIVSPIHVGSGNIKCAHGILPVPAPATAYILRGVPIYGGGIKSELCTPTGAALLRHFASKFGDMPVMKVEAIGYGMGKKDFTAANCVRVLLGTTDDRGDTVTELSVNLDDMTPEAIGFAMECLFNAGALDVYTVPAGMKKNRPGIILCVMCKNESRDEMVKLLFKYTTTLGVRENLTKRYTLNRQFDTIRTAYGDIRKKISTGYNVTREKYEYEDLSLIAKEHGLSLADAVRLIEAQGK